MAAGLQSHVSVQHPLGPVQLPPLLPCEGHSHVLEAHKWRGWGQPRTCFHFLLIPGDAVPKRAGVLRRQGGSSGRSHVGVLGLGWHLGRLDFARKLWATASRRGLSLGVGAVIELRERGDVRRARAGSRGPRAPACNPPHQLATHKMLPSTQGLPYGWTASTKPAPARASNKARPRRALLQERP